MAHYHLERNPYGVGNELIEAPASPTTSLNPVKCRQRLGGMLSYYYREAA